MSKRTKQYRRAYLSSGLFWYTLATCFCIALVPILLSVLVYDQSIHTMKRQCVLYAQSIMSNYHDKVAASVEKMNNDMSALMLDTTIGQMRELSYRHNQNDADQAMQIIKNYSNLQGMLSSVDAAYVFFPKNEAVLFGNSLCFDYQTAYLSGLKSHFRMDYHTWLDRMPKTSPARCYVVGDDQSDALGYAGTFSYTRRAVPDITVLLLIKKANLLDDVQEYITNAGGSFFLTDLQDTPLVQIAPGELNPCILSDYKSLTEISLQQGKMLLLRECFDDVGMNCYMLLPMTFIMKEMISVQTVILLSVIAALILGALLSLQISVRNTLPVIDLSRALNAEPIGSTRPRAVWQRIWESLETLQKQNQHMSETLLERQYLLKLMCVDKLIHGSDESLNGIRMALDGAGMHLTGRSCIAIISVSDDSLIAANVTKLCDEIETFAANRIAAVASGDELCLLVMMEAEAQALIEQIADYLHMTYGVLGCCGVGSVCDQPQQLQRSYYEARLALSYGQQKKERLIFAHDMPGEIQAFFYPLQTEAQLINNARFGNADMVAQILDTVYMKNAQAGAAMKARLIGELSGTLMKLIPELKEHGGKEIEAYLERLNAVSSDFENGYVQIRGLFEDVMERINENQQSKNAVAKKNVGQYIAQNYTDQALGLQLAADAFHMSPSYFSQYFKTLFGQTFTDYVEQTCIKRACELLLQDEYTIESIAQAVGYANARTFRRAFKKVAGCAPALYKRTQAHG